MHRRLPRKISLAIDAPLTSSQIVRQTESLLHRRAHQRISYEIEISIKDLQDRREFTARTMNICEAGIGVIFCKPLRVGDKLEMWVHLPDGLKPVHRYGRLMWQKRKNPFVYEGGIQFESPIDVQKVLPLNG